MASGFSEKSSTPRRFSREMLSSFTLLPSKFLWEKFLSMRKKASPGRSILPRIGPFLGMSETRPKLPSDQQSLLQISPPEVVFENFYSYDVTEMVVSLINKDKFPQVVRVSMERSPYFQLTGSNDAYRVVMPGASVPVHICFTPDKSKYFSHELVCVSGRERIVVPIRAIGARAILNIPDQLDFSKCPVKCSTQKTLLVRNVGKRAARYQLSTKSPFSVVPATGTLGAGDTMQVTVTFHPLTAGDCSGSLCCITDEDSFCTRLHGEAVDVDAGLSMSCVEFEQTYMSLSSHATVLIENRSNVTAHFQWKAYSTEEGENAVKRRRCRFLRLLEEERLESSTEEEAAEEEKGSCEGHTALLSSKVSEEVAKVQEDPMLFSDDVFFLEPMEGEIGPNCSAKIKVTFKPLEEMEYQNVAYCSISGCESRLPLCLTGEGLGPWIKFSCDTLDLGKFCVNTPQVYEVELFNQGPIDAPFTYVPSTSNVGFSFKFAPEKGVIAPDGMQIIQVTFNATVPGRFQEEFQFCVPGSLTSAMLTITGQVVEEGSFLSDLDSVDGFFGSPNSKTSCLSNISLMSSISPGEEAHVPNLQIQPSTLEFGSMVAGTKEMYSVEMTNCSSLPAQYHWSVHSDSQENRLRYELYPPKFKPQPPKEKKTSLDSLASQRRYIRFRKEETARALKEVQDLAQSAEAELLPQISEQPSVDIPLKVEKALSIVPQSGVLQPEQSQEVSFTFCGHCNLLAAGVRALCHVEGGPTRQVELRASGVSYSLSSREISCGLQIFNEIGRSAITLANTGRTEFSWVLNPSSTTAKHLPGVFQVNPTTGSIAPGRKQVLKFSYLPGLPGAFIRIYQLKVGDLEPENICLRGEGFCPMISVNLPWNIKENEKSDKPLKQPAKHMQPYSQRNKSKVAEKKTQGPKTETLKSQTPKTQTLDSQNPNTQDLKPCVLGSGIVSNSELQMKMMRMLIEKAALGLQKQLTSHPPKSSFPDKMLRQSLVKVELPDYILDVGTVLKGSTMKSTLEISNPGQMPVLIQSDVSVLQDTGFSVDLGLMESLAPSRTLAFDVSFESAHQPQGDVDVLLPIKVTKGPTYYLRLRATVVELSLDVSRNKLQFSDILVGQCQVETIRLYNPFQIPCGWFITASKPAQKDNKPMMPALWHQNRQKLEDESCPFKVTPSQGLLNPGKWQDLEIKFTPKEERSYKNELQLSFWESSNQLKLQLSGQGLEPQLEFSPPALKMGQVLVGSHGLEATVVVKNPCNFPIEFYSLDFDEQYLEEEKILRMALGSDDQKSFLMPPRAVGGMLPPEVLENYEMNKKLKAHQAKLKAITEDKARADAEARTLGRATPVYRTATFYPKPMVKGTGNPVTRAVMRHLGRDPLPEQHSGIALIIHGPPRAGKTETAAGLCRCYSAAHLSMDTVVTEAMANDWSPAGLCARELCIRAAMEPREEGEGDAGKKSRLASRNMNKQASTENRKNAKGRNTAAQRRRETASRLSRKDTKLSTLEFTVSTAPAPQQLRIISNGKELSCLSCVLPEDLLVDILCERLKQKDCSKGVVFDGLESLFTSSLQSSLLCVLRAVKNFPHICMVNLHQDYASWKAKVEASPDAEELQKKEAIQRDIAQIWQMDEDDYDAFPEDNQILMDAIAAERKRTQRRRRALTQMYPKEEAKSLEEEEKQPAKPEEGKTKTPEQRGTKMSEDTAEMEKLILRFQIYESSQQDIAQVFSCWDRVQGTVQLPVIQKGNKSQLAAENKVQKTKKPQEEVEKKPEQKHGGQRSLQSSQLETQSKVAVGAARDKHVGVPCLDVQVTDPKAMVEEILRDGRLPSIDQMLKHLELHPKEPPLPPGAVLSIVEYPKERLGPAEPVEPFTIVAPEGAAVEDDLAKAPDVKGSSAKGQPKMGKVAKSGNSLKEIQISTERAESRWDSSTGRSSSTLESASSVPTEFLRLKRYRWIVPAHGEVELKVHFSAKNPGKFEQMLRFELVDSRLKYELPCSGTSVYPGISQNPRVVFPQWRETMEEDEIVIKEYVESTKQFHFGPLLCGKSREWYKAQNCPGNSENLTILNNSPTDVEVQFSFENAGAAETFLLDPPSMTLKPKEKQELTIWAFPTSPGFLEDKLICSIEQNPEPVVFNLCCHGVDMKLEVSPLELSFDKLLVCRSDSRTLVLRNYTLLPMSWQLRGLDDLAGALSLSQDKGIIDPHSEFHVTLHFKARQIGSIEKTLRLEVSDTENILGIFQTENIKISAEVYNVSLSIDMPKGPDGSLEFGTINVQDKVKKVLSLKNKGLYNIEYSLTLKGAGPRMQDMASCFTVEPQSGVLVASQPGVNVEMLFHPTREMLLKNKSILFCQVVDASSGEGGQVVTNIPVRVSAKAEYSKYSIEPASPINFGAVIKGTKQSQTVVLENKGELSFKFRIRQAPEEALESKRSEEEESAKPLMRRKSSSLTQSHLNLGMFTVSPCSGSIGPWGQQKITVECLAGQEGTCKEQLYIDITGRDPKDNPLGIPFTLIAESCLPGLVEDVTSIFEEYPICSSTDLGHKLQSVTGTGLFVRDENKFIFTKVEVGQEAEAHFNIYNASRLPCDVVLSIKALPGEEKSPINNVFKLYPAKMSIPGSSHAVASVTFTPPEEQSYDCTFQASLVIPEGSVEVKPQTLSFTISGKGHEPQVAVVCPRARSRRGNAVLRFERLRLGDSEVLPLVIRNNGIVPVKFLLCLEDEHGAFHLRGRASTRVFHTGDVEEDSVANESKPTMKPFFLLNHGQSTEFDVIFKPTLAQRLEGEIRVLVGDTCSCKTLIELVGEGHKDEFTLIGLEEDTQERNAKSSLKKDVIDAVRVNHIQFGDCPVGEPCQRTFTITNHTRTKVMRYEWDADIPFQFSPKVGHLHPGCSKVITVTLKSDVSATFRRHLVKCKVTKIKFELPQRKVPAWDDQMCIGTWKETPRRDPAARWPKIRKVMETVPEPAHTVVQESSREVEVYLSAVVAYAQFKLSTIMVQFSDSLPFETKTATFSMHNTGEVPLKYSWEKAEDSEPVRKTYCTALMRHFLSDDTVKHRKKLLRLFWSEQDNPETPPKVRRLRRPAEQQQDSQQDSQQLQEEQEEQPKQQQQRPKLQQYQEWLEQQDRYKKLRHSKQKHLSPQHAISSLEVFPDVVHDLFSISPYNGIIAPGQKQTFHLQFSPKFEGKFETTMLCRIPNLNPAQKMGQVIVKGTARKDKS